MSIKEQVSVVLVNTSHPGNIGATARAMKNMGLHKLVLVNPLEFPSGVAVGRAASALDILEQARVVTSLEEALEECKLVIGASARSRSIPWPMLNPQQMAEKVAAEAPQHPVALVLGREDSGLNNEELQLCHYHVQIPTAPKYSSLNLAAAAMVLVYEIHKACFTENGDVELSEEQYWDQPLCSGEQMQYFYEHLERVMVAIDFHDPDNPRQLMQRMRRLFGRIRIDEMEMNILRGILTNIEQQLDKRSQD